MKAKTKYRLALAPAIVLCGAALTILVVVIAEKFLEDWQEAIYSLFLAFGALATCAAVFALSVFAFEKYDPWLKRLKRAANEEEVSPWR